MDIELISVEADLLLAADSDRQAAYVMEKCAQLGAPVVSRMNVTMENAHLTEIIAQAWKRTSVVMVICQDGKNLKKVRKLITEKVLNRKNDELSEQDVLLERHGGNYAGVILKEEEKKLILLPEEELQSIFEQELFRMLQKEMKDTVYSATVKMCGMEEAEVRKLIAELKEKNPAVEMTLTAHMGEIVVRMLTGSTEDHTAKKALKPVLKTFQEKFGEYIYSTDDTVSLEASVLGLLKERELTLTTAESLTGGLLAARFTAVPGASEVFKQGFVTYCNRAKRKLLDVKKTTLKEYGAVSDRTAKEMAKNGVFATGADACISLTGLAGPAAEEGKPVGLVYIACCYKNRTVVRECHFKGDRRQIREQSVIQALLLLRECILADQ